MANVERLEKLLNLAFHKGTGDGEALAAFNMARISYHRALKEKMDVNIQVLFKPPVAQQPKPAPEQPKQQAQSKTKQEYSISTQKFNIQNIGQRNVPLLTDYVHSIGRTLNLSINMDIVPSSNSNRRMLDVNITVIGTRSNIQNFERKLNEYIKDHPNQPVSNKFKFKWPEFNLNLSKRWLLNVFVLIFLSGILLLPLVN
jgi:hypothetical protein